MAWSVVKKNVAGKVPTWRGFIADTVADIDTLPVVPAVASGSECYCSENGATYVLETDGDWAIKGSGGGGGKASAFIVNFSYDSDSDTATGDKSYGEIEEAYNNGQTVLGRMSTDEHEITDFIRVAAPTADFHSYFVQFNIVSSADNIMQTIIYGVQLIDEEQEDKSMANTEFTYVLASFDLTPST